MDISCHCVISLQVSTKMAPVEAEGSLEKYGAFNISIYNISMATTLRCMGGCDSFPWIIPLILGLYRIMPSVKQGGIKYHFFFFLVFGMTQPGIESQSPCHW